jgi:hypothetical protein
MHVAAAPAANFGPGALCLHMCSLPKAAVLDSIDIDYCLSIILLLTSETPMLCTYRSLLMPSLREREDEGNQHNLLTTNRPSCNAEPRF